VDYYKDLKSEDFEVDDGYLVERLKRGLAGSPSNSVVFIITLTSAWF